MSLVALYDELLGDVAGAVRRDAEDIANRCGLIREQLRVRLEHDLGFDEHSFALPALAAYLGNAVRLYVLGFYDAAIIEAESRLAAALQGRLHGSRNPSGPARGQSAPHDEAIPLDRLIDQAVTDRLFHVLAPTPERLDKLVLGLRDLARKRIAIEARNRDQGLQITVIAPASGAISGGPGAAHTEPILGYYLSWGANLHHLLVDAVLAVTLILMAGETQVASSADLIRPGVGKS